MVTQGAEPRLPTTMPRRNVWGGAGRGGGGGGVGGDRPQPQSSSSRLRWRCKQSLGAWRQWRRPEASGTPVTCRSQQLCVPAAKEGTYRQLRGVGPQSRTRKTQPLIQQRCSGEVGRSPSENHAFSQVVSLDRL